VARTNHLIVRAAQAARGHGITFEKAVKSLLSLRDPDDKVVRAILPFGYSNIFYLNSVPGFFEAQFLENHVLKNWGNSRAALILTHSFYSYTFFSMVALLSLSFNLETGKNPDSILVYGVNGKWKSKA